MRASRLDMGVSVDTKAFCFQEAEWGELHAAFETFHEEFDVGPLLDGLPNNLCQCPHWGYVLRGRMHVRYADRVEVIDAGDAYYLASGHAPVMEAGTEIVEFSPLEAYRQTVAAVSSNFAKQQEPLTASG
jgi:hypothetical protein